MCNHGQCALYFLLGQSFDSFLEHRVGNVFHSVASISLNLNENCSTGLLCEFAVLGDRPLWSKVSRLFAYAFL